MATHTASTTTSFSVHLYGPKKAYLKGVACEQIFIPTQKGIIQVLPEHTHLITLLGVGILTLVGKEGSVSNQPMKFGVHSGVCKILESQIILLAKEVYQVADLKKDKLLAQQNSLVERLKSSTPLVAGEFDSISNDLEKITVQLSLLE